MEVQILDLISLQTTFGGDQFEPSQQYPPMNLLITIHNRSFRLWWSETKFPEFSYYTVKYKVELFQLNLLPNLDSISPTKRPLIANNIEISNSAGKQLTCVMSFPIILLTNPITNCAQVGPEG